MPTSSIPPEPIKQVIVVRKDLNMRKGKIAAQAAHAAMMFLSKGATIWNDSFGTKFTRHLTPVQAAWLEGLFTKIVVSVDSEEELQRLLTKARELGVEAWPCTDAGLTEFHGVPTLTCAAFGPDYASRLDPITGTLKPL